MTDENDQIQSTDKDQEKNQQEVSKDETEKTTEDTNQENSGQEELDEHIPDKEVEEKEKEPEEMVEIPKSRLEELENVEAEALEEVKRERAESINYRKRLQKQRDEFAEIASARVLSKLLSVQDDIKRILDNIDDEVPEEHKEAVELLKQRVEGIFASEEVSLIPVQEGETRYDPKTMEALVAQPVPGVKPKTVIQVVSNGFVKGERVLRPAKVIIAKAPAKKEEQKSEKMNKQTEDISNHDTEEPETEEHETEEHETKEPAPERVESENT